MLFFSNGVTIGWLLGVEEPAGSGSGEPVPPPAPGDAGLTEEQLKMVEEIVDRYLRLHAVGDAADLAVHGVCHVGNGALQRVVLVPHGPQLSPQVGQDHQQHDSRRRAREPGPDISVVFITGGVRETQLLETYSGLYVNSLPDVGDTSGPRFAMVWKDLNVDGALASREVA